MTYRYPVLLDVSGRPCVIIGGGAVGARKAKGLLEAGATAVTVVSPEFHPDIPASVTRVQDHYAPRHLEGAHLAFAATSSADVNDAVVRDARARGIWVNRADADEEFAGDFTVPAQLRQGPVLVAVSAAGSPALAAAIRDDLSRRVDDTWTALAVAMQVLRPRIRECPAMPADRRRAAFKELATPAAAAAVRAGGTEALWQFAVDRYPELAQQAYPS